MPVTLALVSGLALHYLSIVGLGRAVEATFFVYMLAILVGAWSGYAQGLLAVFLVIAVFPFLFNPAFTVSRINLVGLASLSVMSVVVSRTSAAQKRAEAELRRVNLDLERRVAAKTQELVLANRLKDEFFAVVSHELRGPLQGIVGYVPLLLSGALDAAGRDKALKAIDRSARALTTMSGEILDASRIITGKMELELATVDLNAVARTAVENVRASVDAKRLALTVVIEPDTSLVRADVNRLQQAIWNLLSNAVKFTPPGGRICLTIRRAAGKIQVEVADTGIGLSPEFIPHAFERFRQADATSTRTHGGLGLGLSIVRHVAEAHGGTVEAGSDGPGRGATFRLSLPAAVEAMPPDPSVAARERQPEPAADALAGLTVLVLDDQADARDTLALALRRYGALVQTAESVTEALESMDGMAFDILVSDLAMPGEDGFSLLRKMRGRRLGVSVPAIAVSGFASDADRARSLDAGFGAHLSKPVDPRALAGAVLALTHR